MPACLSQEAGLRSGAKAGRMLPTLCLLLAGLLRVQHIQPHREQAHPAQHLNLVHACRNNAGAGQHK